MKNNPLIPHNLAAIKRRRDKQEIIAAHKQLDTAIAEAVKDPFFDEYHLKEAKAEKLALRGLIEDAPTAQTRSVLRIPLPTELAGSVIVRP